MKSSPSIPSRWKQAAFSATPSMRHRLMATAYNTFILRPGEISIKSSIMAAINSQLDEEHRALKNMQRNIKGKVSEAELHEVKTAVQAVESMSMKIRSK